MASNSLPVPIMSGAGGSSLPGGIDMGQLQSILDYTRTPSPSDLSAQAMSPAQDMPPALQLPSMINGPDQYSQPDVTPDAVTAQPQAHGQPFVYLPKDGSSVDPSNPPKPLYNLAEMQKLGTQLALSPNPYVQSQGKMMLDQAKDVRDKNLIPLSNGDYGYLPGITAQKATDAFATTGKGGFYDDGSGVMRPLPGSNQATAGRAFADTSATAAAEQPYKERLSAVDAANKAKYEFQDLPVAYADGKGGVGQVLMTPVNKLAMANGQIGLNPGHGNGPDGQPLPSGTPLGIAPASNPAQQALAEGKVPEVKEAKEALPTIGEQRQDVANAQALVSGQRTGPLYNWYAGIQNYAQQAGVKLPGLDEFNPANQQVANNKLLDVLLDKWKSANTGGRGGVRIFTALQSQKPSTGWQPEAIRGGLYMIDQELADRQAHNTQLITTANQNADKNVVGIGNFEPDWEQSHAADTQSRSQMLTGILSGQGTKSKPMGGIDARSYQSLPTGMYFTDPQGNVRLKQ